MGFLRHAGRLADRDVHKQEDPLGCKLNNLIVPVRVLAINRIVFAFLA